MANVPEESVLSMAMTANPPLDEDQSDVRHLIGLPIIQPVVRQSSIGTYYQCPRKFLFGERFGLRGRGLSPAAFRGQAFHLAHNIRYRGGGETEVIVALQNALDSIRESVQIELPDKADYLLQSMHEQATLGRIMSGIHFLKFPPRPDRFEVVALEVELSGRYRDVDIQGRLDMIIRSVTPPYGLYIVDHKTTQMDPSQWLRTAGFKVQPHLYRELVRNHPDFCDEKVLGFCYNMVRVPTIRQKTWQNFELYQQEIVDWYEGNGPTRVQVSLGKTQKWDHSDKRLEWTERPPMVQAILPYEPGEMPEHIYTMLKVVGRASRSRPRLESYPPVGATNGQCEAYGGCTFGLLCESPPHTWDGLTEAYYTSESLFDMADSPDSI